ncbi:metalloregulator ArsR/SmtB family transcription factor [Niveibacterium umoris]|uniref:DNA-binding transcriptional ArsR family regulator n=1 Tax=Niveibacterium umoris TaxID=1193620 RepID=A0A840BKJ6_9RHOO|nr:metalloregulator ArsR/SmtB family transcription factor [Niveibacterium umoris]MBB4011057.1 DNA-binding transcriptional ArsR family regulator [Niveibacterium umoris]
MALPEQAIDRVALYFKALSDPTRLRILNSLRENERSVGELTDIAQCSQANVSKHLRVLADAGIVARTARGTTTIISVADPGIYDLCALVCDSVARELEKDLALHQALMASRQSG